MNVLHSSVPVSFPWTPALQVQALETAVAKATEDLSATKSGYEATTGTALARSRIALNALSVPKPPMWLRENKIPFDAMVFSFPHTADEHFALAAYYQSARMVDFPTTVRDVVRLLSNQNIRPDEAFHRAAGLSPSSVDAAWKDFTRDK